MSSSTRIIAAVYGIASVITCFTGRDLMAQQGSPTSDRRIITSAEQLPRRATQLQMLPSAYLSGARDQVERLADTLEQYLRDDFAHFDIRDQATQRNYHEALLMIAQFRGDVEGMSMIIPALRELNNNAGMRAATGVLNQVLVEFKADQRDPSWLEAEVRQRFGALPWGDVGEIVKAMKAEQDVLSSAFVAGVFENDLDIVARNANLLVPDTMLLSIIRGRLLMEQVIPVRAAIAGGLQAVIGENAHATRPDIWTPRQFSLTAEALANAVVIGIWDAGVDVSLFQTPRTPGIAVDFRDGKPTTDLLYPLGAADARWPKLKELARGYSDNLAGLDTENARRLREYQNALGPEEIAQYQEDVRLVSLYTHGTHVASIAVQGNPFAQVFAATVIQEHRLQPPKPTEERSLGIAEAYREFVRAFQQQNVRVVNMSWALRADHYERWLAWHGMGDSPEQRQQMAQRYFEIERDALRAAMASAPEILFVAGAGNSADSADFRETIPASLSLPNLITVGAVNMAGAETSFSSFGDTVVVHANGFEVDGLLPGGESTKMSGTSMASPQVANLAGKLLALKPQLSAAEIREAIIKSADPIGRVNLLNPRECAALLGIELDN